ncbi:MAG: prolyl oligopeptidase family serine peptidase [Bryobacterales bacterium]|nr:prolyl oligopeptidase family serine peptidase [Bryobacterales bacterium]
MRRFGWLLALTAVAMAGDIEINGQKALFDVPEGTGPFPLLVHLHSWSATYNNSSELKEVRAEAARRNWVFLSPDFRGPNNRPEACGSDLAVADIVDAVAYAKKAAKIDGRRVYLVGGSGGGHMALMMAGRHAKLWTAVSSWVPISDLQAWHAHSKAKGLRYAQMMEQCCGGPPGAATEAEYKKRSPLTYLAKAKGLPVSIHVGIHDGHSGSVPVSHSLWAFNVLAAANGKKSAMFGEDEIRHMVEREEVPAGMRLATPEPGGKFPALLRREAGAARITVFEGGHATDFATAVAWLASHVK